MFRPDNDDAKNPGPGVGLAPPGSGGKPPARGGGRTALFAPPARTAGRAEVEYRLGDGDAPPLDCDCRDCRRARNSAFCLLAMVSSTLC